MNQSTADKVWNRAAMEDGGVSPGPGDRALASLLLLHGLAMNGGIHHAIECLTPEEFSAAIEGFSYFDFDEIADWLSGASSDPLLKKWTENTEAAANFRYAECIPDDGYLSRRFEAVFRDRASDFARC